MRMKNNKRAIVVFPILIFIVLSLVAIYLLMYLPFPSLKALRSLINYIIVLILWIIIQIAILYGYFKLFALAKKGWIWYKNNLLNWTNNLKNFLIMRNR